MCFKLLLLVCVTAMFFEDDDFSLAGLTQEDTGRSNLESSQEDNNLDMLFDCARNLANSEANALNDFENSVFDIGMDSQTQEGEEQNERKNSGNAKRVVTSIDDSESVKVNNLLCSLQSILHLSAKNHVH